MPIIISCPACQVPLRLPDSAVQRGRKMRCPHCKQMLSPHGTPEPHRRPLPPGTKFINGIPVGILVSDSSDVPLAPHERVSSESQADAPDDSDFLDSADVELVDEDDQLI